MIDDLATWVSTYKVLPKVDDSSWAASVSDWVYDRVANAELDGVDTASPPFDFKKAVFKTALEALSPTYDATAGITQFANAWETAIVASSTLLVASGDSYGPPTPATIWSAVTSSLLDAPSIAAGKAIVMSLASSPPVTDPELSDFPVKLRLSFLALTGTTSGFNSVLPPAGPNPLTAPLIPLI